MRVQPLTLVDKHHSFPSGRDHEAATTAFSAKVIGF
jgi:hypothetical protein